MGSIAFPYTHIGGPDYLVMMLLRGMAAVLLESFVPEAAVAVFRRHGVTLSGGSTAFYQAFLAEQRKQPGAKLLPDAARARRRRRAEAARGVLAGAARARRARSCTATA